MILPNQNRCQNAKQRSSYKQLYRTLILSIVLSNVSYGFGSVTLIAEDDNYTITTGQVLQGNVLDNDTGSDMEITQKSDPEHATSFQINSDGSFTYTPEPNYSGDDSFTYTVGESCYFFGCAATRSATVTIHIEAPDTPPLMGPIPNQQSYLNDTFTLDLSNYVTETNDDEISRYNLTCLPNGLTFDTSRGILSGTPTTPGTYSCSATAEDNDGLSNSSSFTLTVLNMEVVNNADDLCYEDPIVSGMMCIDMGICSGGLGCRNTYPLRNQGDTTLTNVQVYYNEDQLGGTFGEDCGVEPSGNCNTEHDIDLGPIGLFNSVTEFNLTNAIEPTDTDKAIWAENFISGSCFSGESLYGSYIKDGVLHRGPIHKCQSYTYDCSKPHNFETRYNAFVTGGLVAIGNSNICADNGSAKGRKGDGVCDDNQEMRNDTSNIIFINKYSANPQTPWYQAIANTPDDLFNVSNATLNLPEGAKVKWAGLYWHGEVWNFRRNLVVNSYGNDSADDGFARIEKEDRIKFKRPIDTAFQELKADEHYWINLQRTRPYLPNNIVGVSYGYGYGEHYGYSDEHAFAYKKSNRFERHYQGYIDVTQMLQEVERSNGSANGTYWVGNIQASLGALAFPGVEAAWTLQVVYSLPGGDPRVVTVSDGYMAMYSNANVGDDYVNNSEVAPSECKTGAENTGVYGHSTTFKIDDIYTPQKAPFNTDMTIFVTESDPEATASSIPESLTITKKDGSPYKVDGDNAWGYEISDKDGNPIERQPGYEAYPIGVTIRNYHMTDALDTEQIETDVTFSTDNDRLIIGVIGFATDVRLPNLCYDYGYAQNGRYFTKENNGSFAPRIEGALYSDAPVNVNLFVKNQETSDIIIKDMKFSVLNIDTTQAKYITDSVKVTYPGSLMPSEPTGIDAQAESFVKGVEVGTVLADEFFYGYYDLDPQVYSLDMPMDVSLDFNTSFTLPNGKVFETPYSDMRLGEQIPMCVDGNFSYAPLYGRFNIEQKILNGKYNIYTQVVNRVDDFVVRAYDSTLKTPESVSTPIAVEVIDAGAFHETQTSCQQQQSAISPRIWLLFTEEESKDLTYESIQDAIDKRMTSETLSAPEAFYSIARQNAAFRVSVNLKDRNGTLFELEKDGNRYTLANFDEDEKNTLDVGNGPGVCGNDKNVRIADKCTDSMLQRGVRNCMECLYGSNTAFVCSRDNFAIRPEAFHVSLSDDNTTQQIIDFANNTDKAGDAAHPINLVAGYPYRFDINATSYTGTKGVAGYTQRFSNTSILKNASMQWNPRSISETQASTHCNVPSDRNMSFALVGGTNTNPNPINTWGDRHDILTDIGEYQFTIYDNEWSKYDWDPALTKHHLKDGFLERVEDCQVGSTEIVDTTDSEPSGCLISNIHALGSTTHYLPLYIRSYPYAIDISGLTYGARAGNMQENTYIYMNTLDPTPYVGTVVESSGDENMSYNIQGEIKAVGFTNQPMKNFVDQCFAEDIKMKLNYQFLNQSEPDNLALQYNLFNSSVPDYIRMIASFPDDHTLTQTKENFVQEQEGSLTMDLGFNFDRRFNQPVNPVYMNIGDFNLSYATQPTSLVVAGETHHNISTKEAIDQNVSFIYAITQPNLFFYDNITGQSVKTPISVTAYCDLGLVMCQNRGLDTITSGLLSDVESNKKAWWFVEKHSSGGEDGTIYLQASKGGVTSTFTPTSGIDNSITVTKPATNSNSTVDIDFAPGSARWLVYNPTTDSVPSPFYRVRFIGSSGWTGLGKTGHVVGDDINAKRNRRVEW